jgi:REP element-mobilizing transposase RayT
MSEIYKNRHAAFNLHVHLVFITKYRKKFWASLTMIILVSVLLRYVRVLMLS